MEIKLWVAIIAASTALFISILNSVFLLVKSRKEAQNALKLEYYKHTLLIDSEHQKDRAKKTMEFLESVQLMKDEMKLAIESTAESMTDEEACDRLSRAANTLAKIYGQCYSGLAVREQKAAHNSKNISQLFLKRFMSDRDDVFLVKLRQELSEEQEILRNSLFTK